MQKCLYIGRIILRKEFFMFFKDKVVNIGYVNHS